MYNYAKQLLRWYVDSAPNFYGSTFVTYNVHNLIHLHEDIDNHQCGLESLSAFPFENFLNRIKKMVRKSHQPISQVTKRIKEMETNSYCMTLKEIQTKVQPNSKNDRNSWFLLKNNKICEVVKVKNDNEFIARLYSFKRSHSYFNKPIYSKLLQICFLPKNIHFDTASIFRLDISKKLVSIPEEDGICCFQCYMKSIIVYELKGK